MHLLLIPADYLGWFMPATRVFLLSLLACTTVALVDAPLLAQAPVAKDPLVNSAVPTPHLAEERSDLQRFNSVARAVAAEKLADVTLLVRRLFDLPEDRWFGDGAYSHGMRRNLLLQLQRLPPRLQELHSQAIASRCEADFQRASAANDVATLLQIATRYPDSATTHKALRQAALICWDRAEFGRSATLAARALPSPESAQRSDLPLVMQAAAARARAGDGNGAKALLHSYSTLFTGRTPAETDQQLKSAFEKIAPVKSMNVTTSDPSYPAVMPVWKVPVLTDPNWVELYDLETQAQRKAGSHTLPAAVPCIAENRLLVRSYANLQAYELSTGQLVWEVGILTHTANSERERRSADNPGFRDFKAQELYRYFAQNQITGTCVADRSQAYFIGEKLLPIADEDDSPAPGDRLRNQLIACRLLDGKVVWETSAQPELRDVFLLSQPILHGSRVYVVGETESQLNLLVIRCADGKLDWRLPLAAVKHDLRLNPVRRNRQVATLWQDGRIICATGAGCILSVDTVTRSYDWAWRYPSRDEIPRTAGRMGPFGDPAKVIAHSGWQRIGLTSDTRRVYFVSPETDTIKAVDLQTGEKAWEQPRDDGLFLGGLVANRLLIAGYRSLKGLDPQTGQIVWQRPIDGPSGLGLIRGRHYLLPLETGPVLSVDAATGKTVQGAHGDQAPLGNLIVGQGFLASLTAKNLEIYGDWGQERDALLTRLKLRPDSGELLQQLYQQMRRGGEVSEVAELLRELFRQQPNPALRSQLILTLLDELSEHPEKQGSIVAELKPLVAALGNQASELRCRIRAEAALGDRAAALRAALQLAAQISIEEFESGADRQTVVRSDRALQGTILQLLQDASDAEHFALEQILDSALTTARDGSDPFALQRFSLQFSHLRWGIEARLNSAAKVGIGWPVFRQELSLLDLAANSDHEISATALWKLGQDMTQRSFRQDAVRYYASLRDQYPDVRLDASHTALQVIADLPAASLLAERLKSGPVDPWPLTKPLISKPKGRTREPFLMPIPMDAVPGSLLDRVNVFVSPNASHLVCQGDWFPGYWEIPIPKSRSPLRELFQTYQGWGLGQLLVVRLGTQMHGVSLLDNTGEPNGRIVWSHDLAEDLSGRFEVREIQNRQGLVESEIVIFDDFGREVGQTCVMQAGYFAYRQRGEIVAVDTATGRVLWRRRYQQDDLRVTGDAESLYVLHMQDKQLETIRVVDGVTVKRLAWPYEIEPRGLFHYGMAIVSTSGLKDTRLQWVRLSDCKVLAEHTLPRVSHRFLMDSQTLGVFHEGHKLAWFQLGSGKLLGTRELDVPQDPDRLSRVHCWQDDQRFYVLPSAIPAYSPLGRGSQVRGGYRQHRVKGTLHALDRRSGDIVWKRLLDDTTIPLDQSRGAPIFVLNFRTLAPGIKEPSNPPAPGQTEGVLRVLDRRSGLDLYNEQSANLAPDFTVEINLENHSLDIHGVTERLRFEYPSQ